MSFLFSRVIYLFNVLEDAGLHEDRGSVDPIKSHIGQALDEYRLQVLMPYVGLLFKDTSRVIHFFYLSFCIFCQEASAPAASWLLGLCYAVSSQYFMHFL